MKMPAKKKGTGGQMQRAKKNRAKAKAKPKPKPTRKPPIKFKGRTAIA